MTIRSSLFCGQLACWPLAALLMAASPASASAAPTGARLDNTLREVLVVTASRQPRPAREIGSTLSWLDSESITARETPFVPELLRGIPGVAVNRGGPVGGLTQVRLRGGEGNHTLVLIDGIEANDPAFGSEFNFNSLQTLGVDRIEVLRGPQSALYGSDAVGGVISIRSALPEAGEQRLLADVSGGSQATTRTGVAAALAGDILKASFSAVQFDSGGINASRFGDEKDGFESRSLHGIMEASISDNFIARIALRQSDSKVEEDTQDFDFPATPTQGLLIDSRSETDFQQRYGLAEIEQGVAGDFFRQRLAFSVADTDNHFRDSGRTTATSEGTRRKAEYDVSVTLPVDNFTHTLTAGLQHEKLEFSNRSADFVAANQDQTDDQTSGIFEYALAYADRFWLSLAARHDRNDRFENATTWRSTASWLLPSTGTRLHGSFGEGIANPGFFELFGFIPASFVGNSRLQPEISRGFDLGLEQSLLEGTVLIDLTAFTADLHDEITTVFDFNTFSSTPVNLDGKSRRKGLELSLHAQFNAAWSLQAGAAFIDSQDRDDRREVRRPRYSGNLILNFGFAEGRGNINLATFYNGRQQDSEFIFATIEDRVTLDEFVLVNLAASWAMTDRLTVYARMDNLFDENYEELFSYRSPGRGGYLGVRMSLF